MLNRTNKYIYGEKSQKIELKHLTYRAFVEYDNYVKFEIPKKTLGVREIYSPHNSLKNILRTINIALQCIYKPNMVAHGFVKNKSIVTNAKNHISKNYVYNIDLEDFFPSIHQPRVWKRFQLPPFNLSGGKRKIANLIANLTCYKVKEADTQKINFLPQGAPTSPFISNIICERLDRRLMGVAKKYKIRYTRYADDITFSSNINVYKKDSEFLKEINQIIDKENFKINHKKTRLQKKGYRQEVTGIITNEKVNVPRKYIKKLRAILFLIEKFGLKKANQIYKIQNTARNIKEDDHKVLIQQVIEGKLNYLKMVKGESDTTLITLQNKYQNCISIKYKPYIIPKITRKKISNINIEKHQPLELVKMLQVFTLEEPLKATTHPENWGDNNYDEFMQDIRAAWSSINLKNKNSFSRLRAKINHFLFSQKLGTLDPNGKELTWGKNNIKFGWSSPALEKWCKGNKNIPYSYCFESEFVSPTKGLKINNFLDVIQNFKKEIEIRSDNNSLLILLSEAKEQACGKEITLCFGEYEEAINNARFFSNVEWLIKGLTAIFFSIYSKKNYGIIVNVEIHDSEDFKYYDLIINHMDTSLEMKPKNLVKRINEDRGSLSTIKSYFISVCDFSIRFNYNNNNYEVDILSESSDTVLSKIDTKVNGFEYRLRFYS